MIDFNEWNPAISECARRIYDRTPHALQSFGQVGDEQMGDDAMWPPFSERVETVGMRRNIPKNPIGFSDRVRLNAAEIVAAVAEILAQQEGYAFNVPHGFDSSRFVERFTVSNRPIIPTVNDILNAKAT